MGQFRRGVCAFNLEALGVLKPTDEAERVMTDFASMASRGMGGSNIFSGAPTGQSMMGGMSLGTVVSHHHGSTAVSMGQQGKLRDPSPGVSSMHRNSVTSHVTPSVVAHVPTVTSHVPHGSALRSGLPQGKVAVRSRIAIEQENVIPRENASKPIVQRAMPGNGNMVGIRGSFDSDQHTPRLREIPPSAHPHPTQLGARR